MNKKKIFIGIILIITGYFVGMISYKYDFFPIKQIKNIYHNNKTPSQPQKQYLDDTISLTTFNNKDFTVIFTFGQSNSANYGQTKYVCQEEVYNWHKGNIFKAKDPLIGASGDKGSVWTRLADKMINQGVSKKILLVPLGIGKTRISQWSKDGEYFKLITETLNDLKARKIDIDYILWHQGESDNLLNTSSESYISDFEYIRMVFRNNDIKAPIFIAIATYHPNENSIKNKQFGCDTIIQNAQKSLIDKFPDIFLGANTDILDKSYYRHDGVHFSVIGLEKHAELWLESIKAQQLIGNNK